MLMENVLLLSINRNANRYIQKPQQKKKKQDEQSTLTEQLDDADNVEPEDVDKVELLQNYSHAEAVGSVTLALKPDEITRITAMTSIGRIYLALRPLKPRSDSMYIRETDYYTATRSSEPPAPPMPVIPAVPPPNIPSPVLPVIPSNAIAPSDEGFEIRHTIF